VTSDACPAALTAETLLSRCRAHATNVTAHVARVSSITRRALLRAVATRRLIAHVISSLVCTRVEPAVAQRCIAHRDSAEHARMSSLFADCADIAARRRTRRAV
jgi:hypothetical protein